MGEPKPLFNADEAEQYFTDLAVYYRNIANDIFKRDNEGRHASEFCYSAEYQKFLGMQLAMKEVLEYFGKFDLQPENENPLTLEELEEMEGEPVWVQSPGMPEYGRWAIVEGVDIAPKTLYLLADYSCHDYGKVWLAYRHKLKEGTK